MHRTLLGLMTVSLGSLMMIACASKSGLSSHGQTGIGGATGSGGVQATGGHSGAGGAVSGAGGTTSTADLDACSSDADCTESCTWITTPTDSSQCNAQWCCGLPVVSKKRCEANQAAWAAYCPNRSPTDGDCPCAVSVCVVQGGTITHGCIGGKCDVLCVPSIGGSGGDVALPLGTGGISGNGGGSGLGGANMGSGGILGAGGAFGGGGTHGSGGVGGVGGVTGNGGLTGSGKVPTNHRPSDAQCSEPAGPGNCGCSACTSQICVADASCIETCSSDASCTKGVNGRCNRLGDSAMCQCTYDECAGDSDCPSGQTCACHGSPYMYNEDNFCIAGNCRIDSDCGKGGYCSPSGDISVVGYYCHTPQDSCTNDNDCPACSGGLANQPRCVYSNSGGSWQCQCIMMPF